MKNIWISIYLIVLFGSGVYTQGIIRIVEPSAPRSWDPITEYSDPVSLRISSLLYQNLYDEDSKGNLTGLINHTSVENGKLSVQLRPGLKWADRGKYLGAVGARDVAETVKFLKSPRIPGSSLQINAEKIIGSPEIISPLQLKFKFSCSRFEQSYKSILNLKIIPYYKIENGYITQQSDIYNWPCGSGAFDLNTATTSVQKVFTRSENYRILYPFAQSNISTILIDIFPAPDPMMASFLKGSVDLVPVIPDLDYIDDRTNNKDVNRIQYVDYSYYFIGFNQANNHNALKQRDIRRAMLYGYNRGAITSGHLRNLAHPIYGPYNQNTPYYRRTALEERDVQKMLIPYDTNLAKRMLDIMGYTMFRNGIRYNAAGEGLIFNIFCLESVSSEIIDNFKLDMNRIGISISVIRVNRNDLNERVYERRDYDLVYDEMFVDRTLDISGKFHSRYIGRPNGNFLNFSNPEIDRLLDSYTCEDNVDEKARIGHDLNMRISQECPMLFLWATEKFTCYKRSLRNVGATLNPFNFYKEIYEWIK